MSKGTYQLIDHTADTGVLVSAPTVEALFEAAGEAFCDLIAEKDSLETHVERRVEISRNDYPQLLQGFLSELLFLFETRQESYPIVRLETLTEKRLVARVAGGKVDPSHVKTGIKGVTYHQLSVDQTKEGWRAEIIFDV